jgi:DNA cross-link repair 1A protein
VIDPGRISLTNVPTQSPQRIATAQIAPGDGGGAGAGGGRLGALYLDTTYCDPRWTFPPQRAAIEAACAAAVGHLGHPVSSLARPNAAVAGGEREDAPSMSAAAAAAAALWAPRAPAAPRRRRVLLLVGAYSLGKERLYLEVCHGRRRLHFRTIPRRNSS